MFLELFECTDQLCFVVFRQLCRSFNALNHAGMLSLQVVLDAFLKRQDLIDFDVIQITVIHSKQDHTKFPYL